MDRKEVIEILKYRASLCTYRHGDYGVMKYYNALQTAIETMQQVESGEYIESKNIKVALNDYQELLNQIKNGEYVKVVHCKNCKYPLSTNAGGKKCKLIDCLVNNDFGCLYGEKKEG